VRGGPAQFQRCDGPEALTGIVLKPVQQCRKHPRSSSAHSPIVPIPRNLSSGSELARRANISSTGCRVQHCYRQALGLARARLGWREDPGPARCGNRREARAIDRGQHGRQAGVPDRRDDRIGDRLDRNPRSDGPPGAASSSRASQAGSASTRQSPDLPAGNTLPDEARSRLLLEYYVGSSSATTSPSSHHTRRASRGPSPSGPGSSEQGRQCMSSFAGTTVPHPPTWSVPSPSVPGRLQEPPPWVVNRVPAVTRRRGRGVLVACPLPTSTAAAHPACASHRLRQAPREQVAFHVGQVPDRPSGEVLDGGTDSERADPRPRQRTSSRSPAG
jgi:hypothetical protein